MGEDELPPVTARTCESPTTASDGGVEVTSSSCETSRCCQEIVTEPAPLFTPVSETTSVVLGAA